MIMPELHLLRVLFETNLVGKISIKASNKAQYLMPNQQLFNAHFRWVLATK